MPPQERTATKERSMRYHVASRLSSGVLPESCSGTRSVLIPRPAARRVSAFSAFRKSLLQQTQKDFPNLPKMRRLTLGAGHLRQLGDPSTLRANPIPEEIPMSSISLAGIIASVPVRFSISNDLTYTSFRLRVHGSYLDSQGAPYSYAEEHTVICVGKLDYLIRAIPRDQMIEVDGELRSRIHVLRVGGPLEIDVAYPLSEVVADTIRWLDLTLSRTAADDSLIALYKPDPA
jgi:hypothetical protein